MPQMMLPLYLLVLAAFLLFMNLKAGSRPSKVLSYWGMWAAVGGSVVTAVGLYQ